MPSPIGHSLAGLIVHAASARDASELRAPRRIAIVVGAALAADVDLTFRFFDGRNHHNNETHSLGAALLAAVVVLTVARLAGWTRPLSLALAAGAAWGTHVLLDYLNLDTNPPIGILALWPWSDDYYKWPWPLFLDIGRTIEWETVRKNAVAGAWEAATLGPLAWLAWRRRMKG
jgi:membrane-bound metal-dependent hydrolase YbcI (DUF457 family)